MEQLVFSDGKTIVRTLTLGALGYAAMVAMLRLSGKRTLTKMNMFDLVITVAFGSVLATLMLSKDTSLVQGVVAIGLLVVLQFLVTLASIRSRRFAGLVKAEPRLLFHRGKYIEGALREERVTKSEVEQAVRSEGYGSLESIAAVVMETNGDVSVIADKNGGAGGLVPAEDGTR